jgi:hypothetical protein
VKDWLTAMRCLVCNAEMVLMEAVLADPTILPGFEHRTFSCSACRDIERRLVFTGAKAPAAAHRGDFPSAKLQMGRGTVPGSAWGRAVEKVLSRQKALNDRAGALRGSERTSALEKKLRSDDHAAEKRPSTTTTMIWSVNSIGFGTIQFPQRAACKVADLRSPARLCAA